MRFGGFRLGQVLAPIASVAVIAGCAGGASTGTGSSAAPTTAAPASQPATSAAASASPSAAAAAGGRTTASGTLKTLKVGLSTTAASNYAPVQMAQQLGLYEKNGLKVTITEYTSGAAAQEALASGDADIIHYFPPGVANAVAKGVKEKIVATDEDRPYGWNLAVKANGPIKSPQDLAGKKIAVTAKGTTTDAYGLWAINQYHLQGAQTVPVGYPALAPSVISGNVDATILIPPATYKQFGSGQLKSLVDLGKTMPPNLPDVIVASDKLISSDPQALRSYLTSVYSTVKYIKQHRNETVQFLVKYTKQDQATEETDYDQVVKQLPDNGTIQPDWLQNSLNLAKLGGTTSFPPTSDFYTSAFTPVKTD